MGCDAFERLGSLGDVLLVGRGGLVARVSGGCLGRGGGGGGGGGGFSFRLDARAAFRRGDGGFGLARFALRAGPSASVGRAGPLARAGLAPSSAGAVALAGAGVTVPSSASKSASKSASPPMLPISSMTYVPLEGVVTTTPACLNTDMVFFQGSDWPAMTRGCRRKGGEG